MLIGYYEPWDYEFGNYTFNYYCSYYLALTELFFPNNIEFMSLIGGFMTGRTSYYWGIFVYY